MSDQKPPRVVGTSVLKVDALGLACGHARYTDDFDIPGLAHAKVLDGVETWGPMAIAANRMIVRDTLKMICLDISEQ